MILLLDAGNSRFKWTELRDGTLSPTRCGDYKGRDPAQAVIAALQNQEQPTRLLLCSVLDEAFQAALAEWAQAHFNLEIERIVTRQNAFGIRVAYAQPERLGCDRYAALVAARRRCAGNCVIIDCGTAITLDALAAGGDHRGGLILPGVSLMRAGLRSHTAGLKSAQSSEEPVRLFGRDTQQAIDSGTLRTAAAAIDRIGDDMAQQLEPPVVRLLCGGDAQRLAPLLRAEYQPSPDLVLHGLAAMAED